MPDDRDELIRRACSPDPQIAFPAAHEYFQTAIGEPLPELIRAITRWPFDAREALLNVAQLWSGPEISRALLDALRAATSFDEQFDLGWFLKRNLAFEHLREAIELARDERLDPAARSWLIEGIENLATGRRVGWPEIAELVELLVGHASSQLRSRIPGLLSAIEWQDELKEILERLLADSKPEVVKAAARMLEAHPEVVRRIDRGVLEGALRKRSSAVRGAIVRMMARDSKAADALPPDLFELLQRARTEEATFEAFDRASKKDDQRIDLYFSLERNALFIGWSIYAAVDRARVTDFEITALALPLAAELLGETVLELLRRPNVRRKTVGELQAERQRHPVVEAARAEPLGFEGRWILVSSGKNRDSAISISALRTGDCDDSRVILEGTVSAAELGSRIDALVRER